MRPPALDMMSPAAKARAKTLVIVNPVAGGGRGGRTRAAVADYLRKQGAKAELVESRSTEDVRRLAAEAADAGYAAIVALGGDGTFHHVVNGAMGRDVVLGFFPAGNGNDIASGLGIPQDPVAAAHAFLTRAPRPVDALRARLADGSTQIYLGVGGMGLDADAAQLVHGRFRWLPGAARYIAAALWALATFHPLGVEAEMDGARVNAAAMFAAVANSPGYGSGLMIAPAATMDDGMLDVTLVGALDWTEILEAIPVMFRTGDLRWPQIQRFRTRRVALRADRPALFHGDGEVLGHAPVEVEVLPGAVRVAGVGRR